MSTIATAEGGWYRTGDPSGPYLDWSSQIRDGGRNVELGDGTDAVVVGATSQDLQQLLDEFRRALAADPEDAVNILYLAYGDQLGWTAVGDGIIRLKLADGETYAAVDVDVTTDELQAIHAQLTEDLAAGD